MADYPENIGSGGCWIRESKNGKKFLSWTIEYQGAGGIVLKVSGVAFKNEKKEGKQPDYSMKVSKWEHAPAREQKPKEYAPPSNKPTTDDSDIPF